MKVYENPGEKILSGRNFEWNGRHWIIPAVYTSKDGLTVDFCVMIPMAEAEEYLARCSKVHRIAKMTDEEREIMNKDNPFCLSFHAHAELDADELPSMRASSISWHPCRAGGKYKNPEIEGFMDEYNCSRKDAWHFVRFFFGWPHGRKQKFTQAALSAMKIKLCADPVFYPGFHFKTEKGQPPQDLAFTHPATKEMYKLNILSCKADILPDELIPSDRGLQYPMHYLVLSYKVTPDIPSKEFRIQDCNPCDPPHASDAVSQKHSASAIAIIGGAGGPISIFTAGKDSDGSIVYPACSSPHFSPVSAAEWRTSFYIKECEDLTVDRII